MSEKQLGQEFEELTKLAMEIPEVADYLESFSVVIGDLIFARRIQLGLTQLELAQLANTTQATISNIEAGKEGTKIGTLNRVFRILKLATIIPWFDEEAAAI